ncbi:hypothetical protein HHK36_030386 [Tetracentron sinense]|uniref:UDP-glucose/GDP-mannose dehydrogenase N-terminal domain-containing protein n=1 Tax=Tetracentron sinense TaxID=13715 RepID=A0A834Y9I9_TETSI|nr:hypothetical protein HHK36_030386 [Tetracentron sinense]
MENTGAPAKRQRVSTDRETSSNLAATEEIYDVPPQHHNTDTNNSDINSPSFDLDEPAPQEDQHIEYAPQEDQHNVSAPQEDQQNNLAVDSFPFSFVRSVKLVPWAANQGARKTEALSDSVVVSVGPDVSPNPSAKIPKLDLEIENGRSRGRFARKNQKRNLRRRRQRWARKMLELAYRVVNSENLPHLSKSGFESLVEREHQLGEGGMGLVEVGASSKSIGLQESSSGGPVIPMHLLDPRPSHVRLEEGLLDVGFKTQDFREIAGPKRMGLSPGGTDQDSAFIRPHLYSIRASEEKLVTSLQGMLTYARSLSRDEDGSFNLGKTASVSQIQSLPEESCDLETPAPARRFREPRRNILGKSGSHQLSSSSKSLEGRFWDAASDCSELEQYTPLVFTELKSMHSSEEMVARGTDGKAVEPLMMDEVSGDKGAVLLPIGIAPFVSMRTYLVLAGLEQEKLIDKGLWEQSSRGLQVTVRGEVEGSQVFGVIEGGGVMADHQQALGAFGGSKEGSSSIFSEDQACRSSSGLCPFTEVVCEDRSSCATSAVRGVNQVLLPQMCPEAVSEWVVNHIESVGQALGLSSEGRDIEVRRQYQNIVEDNKESRGRPIIKSKAGRSSASARKKRRLECSINYDHASVQDEQNVEGEDDGSAEEPLGVQEQCLEDIQNICCIGAGHVGGLSMAVVAENYPEKKVTVVDSRTDLIDKWRSDERPYHEPDFEELFTTVYSNNLFFSDDIETAIGEAGLIFIAVDVPTKVRGSGEMGRMDLTNWERAIRKITEVSTRGKIIVEKSTVPFETIGKIREIASTSENADFHIISNPEFFSQGTAVHDLRFPSRVVIGSSDQDGFYVELLKQFYSRWVQPERIITLNNVKSLG